MKKTGRNDPCPCGSGKKFKKCCEAKMIGGRFMATRVEAASSQQIRKAVNMTSLFRAQLAATPKKPAALALDEAPNQEMPAPGVQGEESSPEKSQIC